VFQGKFQRSVAIAKESFAVLKANPTLAFFPAFSGLATLLVSAPFLIAIAVSQGIGQHVRHPVGAIQYVLLALMYFCSYFVIIFFNSALVACANENLQGRPATLGFGLRSAVQRLPQILGWTAISSTVGLALRLIGDRLGFVGEIVVGIIGFGWNLAVFFVVPVLVIDRESPVAAIKTSSGMLRSTWGERVMLGFGVGTAIALFAMLAIIPMIAVICFLILHIWMLAGFFFILALMIVLVTAVVGGAITAIYQTALYLYCRNGLVAQGFSPDALQGAFMVRPERKVFGMRLGR
jgi:hypothetical protein